MVTHILEERDFLRTMLNNLSLVVRIYPSDANFLLVQFDDAKSVMHYLIEHTVIVRDRSKVHLCDGCLRITVGTREENEVLLGCLTKYHQNNVIA
jgi:histidinol-phosphate aminotransferase